MPDACSRSVDILEQFNVAGRRGEMPTTKKGASPSPFHKKLLSPGPFQKRFLGKAEKPAPLPSSGFSRDARGSLEIFGASAHRGSTPVFSSPAWHDALDTVESLFQKSDSPARPNSLYGDESEASSSEKGASSLWKTESRSQMPAIDKSLPRPRPFHARAKAVSPVSITLEYGGSDHEFSLDADSDVELALPIADGAVSLRRVPLTPHSLHTTVAAVYQEPVDIEQQWRAMLDGTALKAKRGGDSLQDQADDHWQGVLNGGVEGPVAEEDDGDESMRRRSGTSSEYSDEVISERAAKWGYGVPMRASTEFGDGHSTVSWRTSNRSSGSRSSGGSTSSQTIPRVAKDVRDAITSFNLAFVVCDATGADPKYPILYASGGFFKMTGYEADEIIGSNCRILQGPGTEQKEVEKIRKALRAGAAYSGKILNYKKDGTPFWNVLSMSPIRNNEGQVIKYIGMQAEASEKSSKPKSEKKTVTAVVSKETVVGQKPKAKPAFAPAAYIPEISLPPLRDEAEDAMPRVSYRYSLSKSRQSNESAADWHALARLRAEIVSSARALGDAPPPPVVRGMKVANSPRTRRVARLFSKLNSKLSDRMRTPEIEYVDCERDENALSTLIESDPDRRRRSSIFSRTSADFRLDGPSDFSALEIPERGDRLSSSHCTIPTVTHGGRSQFVIIH
uniref:Putative LOV domain-containing protein n=1 Tax=Marchantia polymorpha TaxID=3197 RepID=A0A126WYH0_MARPO|nr:putative LOV domain-containing protein [Marchantia polymorpha]